MTSRSLRMDHFAVPVFDVAATHRFYADMMQLPLIEAYSGDDWGGKPWLMMIFALGDGTRIALCALRGTEKPADEGLPRDIRHFAFAAASEADREEWKRKLRTANVEFWEEDHGSHRSIYFPDPNGIILEITTAPSGPQRVAANPEARQFVERWIEGGQ